MSRPRFLTDQDFNEHIIRGASRIESLMEFMKVRELGMDRSTDAEILEYAAAHQLIVVSHDVNTMSAAASARVGAGKPFAGLLLVHQDSPIADALSDLVLIWAASEAEEWVDQVRYLPL